MTASTELLCKLKLAAILLDVRNQPRAAMQIVDGLDFASLSVVQNRKRDQIRAQALQLIEAGHIELPLTPERVIRMYRENKP